MLKKMNSHIRCMKYLHFLNLKSFKHFISSHILFWNFCCSKLVPFLLELKKYLCFNVLVISSFTKHFPDPEKFKGDVIVKGGFIDQHEK